MGTRAQGLERDGSVDGVLLFQIAAWDIGFRFGELQTTALRHENLRRAVGAFSCAAVALTVAVDVDHVDIVRCCLKLPKYFLETASSL